MDRTPPKIGRNQPCPCGSGKKYKKCCLGAARPDVSVLHDRIETSMQAGYSASMAGNRRRACTEWNETWQLIRARLEPQMRTCEQAEVVFEGSQLIYNWLSDFSTELLNATLDDGPRFGGIGERFCQEVLAQFADETDDFKAFFRAELGDILCRAGRLAEGEQVFLDLIRDRPGSASGYVKLADALSAAAADQQALTKPDADDFDVAHRLANLRGASAPA